MGLFKFIKFAVRSYEKFCSQSYTKQEKYRDAYKIKAQNEVIVKGQIQNFPTVKVKWVIDGDTVIVVKDWSEIVIRLDSIDSPEVNQYWGDAAKYGLMKLINRRNVSLEEHGVDCHGRMLATIYVWHEQKNEWLNVNERMVTLGHAWVMRLYYDHLPRDRQNKFNRLEQWAKSKKIGLWRESSPVPPWKWRNADKSSLP